MKVFLSILLLLSLSWQVGARSEGVTLNEAVNQVKSEGRVLSAKTINGRHEIKVLTPSGTVKTINKNAARPSSRYQPPANLYNNYSNQNPRDREHNPIDYNQTNNKYNDRNKRNSNQNDHRVNTRQLDLQPRYNNNRNKTNRNKNNRNKSNSNKDKDK